MFSETYVRRVLDPSYQNWKHFFLDEFFQVQRAHLVMLHACGIVDRPTAQALKKGIEEIIRHFHFPPTVPPNMEDVYFTFEQELARRIGGENAGRLHIARSRNDMDTTVFRLRLKKRLIGVLQTMGELVDGLQERMAQKGEKLIVLYTHGQPANVSTLAHYLSAFALDLLQSAHSLMDSVEEVNQSTLGACAITTTSFPIDPVLTANLLGLAAPVTHSYRAISGSHWLVEPAARLETVLLDITRFMADLSHKASCEVGIITFPDELVQVSSIMPQKRNPVILEHIRIQAGLALGIFKGIQELFHNLPYQDVNEVSDAPVVEFFRALEWVSSCFDLCGETFRKIDVNEETVKKTSFAFGITATELADALVQEKGLDFRSAHTLTSQFVKGGNDKVRLREEYARLTGKPLDWSDEQIDSLLSPERFVRVRAIAGGPAPKGMREVRAKILSERDRLNRRLNGLKEQMENAQKLLREKYEGI